MSTLKTFSVYFKSNYEIGRIDPWGYLGEGVLHDGPVGHPPGTLQHQVGVGVPLRGGVLQQQVPLVQLLTTSTKTRKVHTHVQVAVL